MRSQFSTRDSSHLDSPTRVRVLVPSFNLHFTFRDLQHPPQGMLSVGPSDSTFLKSSICFERLSPCLASFLTRRMPCFRATRPSVTRKKSRKELPERTTRRPPVTLDPSPSPAWNRRRYARSETSQLVATHQAAGALPGLFELHVANVLQTASERGGGVIHLLASTFVMRNAHVCV